LTGEEQEKEEKKRAYEKEKKREEERQMLFAQQGEKLQRSNTMDIDCRPSTRLSTMPPTSITE